MLAAFSTAAHASLLYTDFQFGLNGWTTRVDVTNESHFKSTMNKLKYATHFTTHKRKDGGRYLSAMCPVQNTVNTLSRMSPSWNHHYIKDWECTRYLISPEITNDNKDSLVLKLNMSFLKNNPNEIIYIGYINDNDIYSFNAPHRISEAIESITEFEFDFSMITEPSFRVCIAYTSGDSRVHGNQSGLNLYAVDLTQLKRNDDIQ